MNCDTALRKAEKEIREGKKPSMLHIRSVWLHASVLQSPFLAKNCGITKPKPLGAGKWSVAYADGTSEVILLSVNASTGHMAHILEETPVRGMVSVNSVREYKAKDPWDGKELTVYAIRCPRLTPISAGDAAEISYVEGYMWSLPRLIRKYGEKKALRKILRHIALVEYQDADVPPVVRELFNVLSCLYAAGYWHTDLWRPNLFRDKNGNLTLVDVGALRPLKKVKWEGRPDPYKGNYVTRMGNANVEKQIERLTKDGWYPPKAARAQARKLKVATKRYIRENQ